MTPATVALVVCICTPVVLFALGSAWLAWELRRAPTYNDGYEH